MNEKSKKFTWKTLWLSTLNECVCVKWKFWKFLSDFCNHKTLITMLSNYHFNWKWCHLSNVLMKNKNRYTFNSGSLYSRSMSSLLKNSLKAWTFDLLLVLLELFSLFFFWYLFYFAVIVCGWCWMLMLFWFKLMLFLLMLDVDVEVKIEADVEY